MQCKDQLSIMWNSFRPLPLLANQEIFSMLWKVCACVYVKAVPIDTFLLVGKILWKSPQQKKVGEPYHRAWHIHFIQKLFLMRSTMYKVEFLCFLYHNPLSLLYNRQNSVTIFWPQNGHQSSSKNSKSSMKC